jgi:hypothetical protein
MGVAAAIAIVSACAPSDASSQTAPAVRAATRTANGVLLHEHRADALDRAPQLTPAATPDAIVGGDEGDPAFDLTYLSSVIHLRGGQVVTYSRIGSKLAVFSPNGGERRLIGRQGQGPGEFIRASVAAGAADSLMVVDGANRRISWILADRGVVAERSLATSFDGSLSQVVGYLPPGRIVMTGAGRVQRGESGRIVRLPAAVGVVSARDGTQRALATVPDLEIAMVETRFRGRAGVNAMPLRFSRRAIVAVWDTLIAITGSDDTSIDLMSAEGQVLQRLMIPLRRRPVTAQLRQAVIDRELARFTGPQGEGMVDRKENERLARESPFADSLPAIADLFVASDGLLWIVDGYAAGEAR